MTEQIVKPKKSSYNMRNAIVNYYLFIMFVFFELFLTNQYAYARRDKFIFYIVATGILIVSVAGISIAYVYDKNAPVSNRVIEHVPIRKISATDIAFFSFVIFAGVSTLTSDYIADSLTGNAGRNNGYILLLLYFAMYIIISRFFYYKEYVFDAFMASACVVAGLAVLHYFYIDPIGIMNGYSDDVIRDFGTTIGNKNTIASYMCIFLPLALSAFVVYKNKYVKILSAISIFFAYTGMLVADSNSGYLGLIVIVFFLMCIFVRKYEHLKNYLLALTIMFASGKLLRLFSYIMDDKSKGFEAIAEFLIYDNRSYIIVAVCVAMYCLMCIIKPQEGSIWPKNLLTAVVVGIGIVGMGMCIYTFIKYTFIDTTSDIGSLSQIFRFDDRWGTHRGFMWIKGLQEYSKFDLVHILFGSGCDTFYHVFEPHFAELSSRFNNSSTDCAHNEFLNYLVTQGAVGLLSYIAILCTTVYNALKNSKDNLLPIIFVAPVVCYCAQSVVNISQPITTPFLFIFISLCECISRKSNPVNLI